MEITELANVAQSLVAKSKGILAADESDRTIKKRFDTIGVESTPDNRRAYREMLFATPGIEAWLSGVILFDKTLRQSSHDNIPFPKLLADKGILPGIKVDKGTVPLPGSPDETITEGLDGLAERLAEYRSLGAKFAKWRAVISIKDDKLPTPAAIDANAEALESPGGTGLEAFMSLLSKNIKSTPLNLIDLLLHEMEEGRFLIF